MNSNKINSINSHITPDKSLLSLDNSSLNPSNINFDNVLAEVFQQDKVSQQPETLKSIEHNFNASAKQIIDSGDIDIDKLFAQGINNQNIAPIFEEVERRRRQREQDRSINQEEFDLAMQRYSVTPFQMYIEKSIEVLGNISKLDYRVNDLTEQFMRGEVSVDEVSFEINKLNLAITFATTVISSASQTFKELTQLQI